MRTYIMLLRGINVGGKSILRMNELKSLLEKLDLKSVKTYIQSGNVVFQTTEENASRLPGRISAEIKKSHDFEPQVLLLKIEEMEEAVESNPFPEAVSEPKTLHLSFLNATPVDPDLKTLESLKRESERFELKGKVFYLHAPDGIGRSKLAAKVERSLGVPMTGRNWRTVSKILAMAKELDQGAYDDIAHTHHEQRDKLKSNEMVFSSSLTFLSSLV
jgi:uncharacterized protein (DUF1697 family)